MKKSTSKKTILKESGVLLIAAILVLTALVVPMKAAQTADHDVGVTGIISPTTGPVQTYPVEVTVENFGTNAETGVPVNVVIETGDGTLVYDATTYIDINAGQSMNVFSPDWYPPETGKYQVTACTQLVGDENSSNDCLTETFHITIDFMGLGVAPLGLADLAIINSKLHVSNCVSGLNDTDGVWTNLEDTYNQWECIMENPFLNDSGLKRTLNITTFYQTIPIFRGPNGPYSQSSANMEDEGDDIPYKVTLSDRLSGAVSAGVAGFVSKKSGMTLVFYKEHIPTEDGVLNIGYTKASCGYLGYQFGNQLSVGLTYSSPVQWTWPEQGVNSLSVDRIVVTPEGLNQTFTSYSYSNMYVNNISAFNITEMHAEVNNPPSVPTIDGPASGKVSTKYDYKLTATDPDNESVYYFVDWGDGSDISSIGPFPPGEQTTVSHTWSIKGTYTIRAQAMDEQYSFSDWATLQVKMPRTYTYTPLILKLLERFPNAFPILRHLMGLYK